MEDINGSLGIRVTIDADDIQKGSNEYVQRIQDMQLKTDEAARQMNSSFDELMKGISNFGRSANGVSLSELQTQLDEAKKSFVSASQEVKLQKGIIQETTQALGDLKSQLADAKEKGKGIGEYSKIEAQIKEANAAISEQKYALSDLEKEQATAKEKVTELSSALSELQNMQPSFEGFTNGAEGAANKVAMLTEEFNKFMDTYNSVKDNVNTLSMESANAMMSGQSGEQAIAMASDTQTRIDANASGIDLSQFSFEGYKTDAEGFRQELQSIAEAYSASAAAASVAYEQQAANVDALTQRIADLKQMQSDALKGGDTESAAKIAEQIKILEGELGTAQTKMGALAEKAQQANDVLAKFQFGSGLQDGKEQIDILKTSLDEFLQKVEQSKTEIAGISDGRSADEETAKDSLRTINYGTSFTDWGESSDQTTQRTEAVKAAMQEVNEAYTNSAAKAKVAFTEQANLVQDLENKIKELQTTMEGATQSGNMDVANEAARQIEVLNPLLTDAKNNMSDLQKQSQDASQRVVNFGNSTDSINKKLEDNSTTLGRVKQTFKDVGGFIGGKFKANLNQGKQVVGSLVDTIDGMGIPLSSSINGMKGLTKETIKFVFTPLGAIITAVTLGLKALHTWLTKSAEGQKVMSKVSAYLGSIMSSLMDIVMALGKSIFKSFSASRESASSFISYFVKSFVSGFNIVKNVVFGFGKTFKGLWQAVTGNFSEGWETLKNGASDFEAAIKELPNLLKNITNGIIEGTKTLGKGIYGIFTDKELQNSVVKSFAGMFSKAREAMNNADKSFTLKGEEHDAQKRAKVLDDEIAKGRDKVYKLTGKAKQEEIARLKVLEREKYYGKDIYDQKTKTYRHEKGLLDIEREKKDIIEGQNKLHTKSLAMIKAEREANLSYLQMQVQASTSTRALTRMEAANERKMSSAASSNAKKDVNKSNAVVSAESKRNDVLSANLDARIKERKSIADKIADATIAADANAEERVRKERERRNKKELEDIANQHDAAIAAEIKRQKAEFDAEQAIVKAKGGKVRKWDAEKDLKQGPINEINNQFEQLATFTQKKQEREQYDAYAQEFDKANAQKQAQINKLKADIASLEELLNKAQGDFDAATTNEERNAADATKKNIQHLRENALAQLEWVENSKDAWVQYCSSYGTFLEQRAALDEKFAHDTQGMDRNSIAYKIQLKKYKADISKLTTEGIKSSIDWSSVFSDIGMMSGKMARVQMSQLQRYTSTDEFKGLNASDQKTITDAISSLQQKAGPYIVGAFKDFGKSVDNYKDALNDLSKLKEQEVEDYNTLYVAKQNEADAANNLAIAQDTLNDAIKRGSEQEIENAQAQVNAQKIILDGAKKAVKEAQDSATQSSEAVNNQSNIVKNAQENVRSSGKNLTSSFSLISSTIQSLKSGSLSGTFNAIVNLADAFSNLGKASNKNAKANEKNAQKTEISADKNAGAQDKMSDQIQATGRLLQSIPNVWTQAIGAVLSLLDSLGDDLEGGIGSLVGTLLDKIGNIVQTLLTQVFNGKFFADIGKGIFSLFGGIASGFASIFGGNGNWNSYRKAVEKYKELDKIWTSLISKKQEYLSLSFGDEAKEVSKELVNLAKADLEATQKLSKQYLRSWKRGSHSAGYYFNKDMEKGVEGVYWSDISRAVGANITQVNQLSDLSYKQLEKLKTQYTDWWIKLPEEYRNYLDSIIEKQNTLEDAQEAVLEKLTGVKFDDMYSSFMSALSDMSKGADEFVSDFKNKMLTALIENTMGDDVKKWTQDFVKRYQQAVKDNGGKISDATAQQFREEISEASDYFFNRRESIANSIGMGSADTDSTQKQGYATASEESIEELSGRALAQTEALYTISAQYSANSEILANLDSSLKVVVEIEGQRTPYYEESIQIQRNALDTLTSIQRNTNELYVMNERLDKIERNTRNL